MKSQLKILSKYSSGKQTKIALQNFLYEPTNQQRKEPSYYIRELSFTSSRSIDPELDTRNKMNNNLSKKIRNQLQTNY